MLVTNMRSIFLVGSLLIAGAFCQRDDDSKEALPQEPLGQNKTLTPKERMFSFLQVMKFPNDVCAGNGGKNGTCYSSDECSSKGGANSGTCANGFGVCCVFTLGCGQTTSENNTYLVLGATTTPSPSVCTYTLCENNPNICRIKLEFNTFVINGPVTGLARGAAAGPANDGGAYGDCIVDTFTLSAPGNRASPVICGTNTGQHMFIDTSSGCARATFDFGAASFSRSYEIKVIQYSCGDEMAGPSDCLQYYTTDTGTIKSFNFNLNNGLVGLDSTHLSNQFYSMCFRRNSGKCTLCFVPSKNDAAPNSFGLSVSGAAAAQSVTDANCIADYLMIPMGVIDAATAKNGAAGAPTVMTGIQRICGRFFHSMLAGGATAFSSICTGQKPFKVIFNTDANEVTDGNNGGIASADENVGPPSGIIGFSLDFTQGSC